MSKITLEKEFAAVKDELLVIGRKIDAEARGDHPLRREYGRLSAAFQRLALMMGNADIAQDFLMQGGKTVTSMTRVYFYFGHPLSTFHYGADQTMAQQN